MLRELMKPAQSRSKLTCQARHPSKAGAHHHRSTGPSSRKPAKKRDISTSFRRGPVPRPLVNTTHQLPAQEDEPIIGIPPPACSTLKAGNPYSAQQAALSQAEASTGLSLGEPCRIGRAGTEPVIAAAIAAAVPVLTARDLGITLDDSPISSSSDSDDSSDALWAADPLASFDRVLDGLLVAPVPQPFPASKASSNSSPSTRSSSLTLSSLLSEPLASTAAGQQPAGKSSSTPSTAAGKKSKGSKSARLHGQSMAAAAAAPAVTVIHCETEYERELEAAAALQQLLVVKVESTQHLGVVSDSSLRFQTHNNLPTQLNTYLAHSDLSTGLGLYTNSSAGSSSSASGSTADVLASMGVPLGMPASNSSSMGPSSSLFGGPGSSSSGEPFSPVHAWYKQLAAQYAHSAAAAGQASPVRFLSVQSDGVRARAVARRLGVSAPLAVVLVDAASGRKLQEVCGAKIEQELPNGLLYFGGSDPQGQHPTERLAQLSTEAELEALRSSSQLAVAAFHVHAAPPCVRSYARMHRVAQQYTGAASASPSVAFGVMDVDIAAEGGAVSSKLGLQHLPTYVIYQDGQETARLSSSPDRRRLGEVLAEVVAAVAHGAAGSKH